RAAAPVAHAAQQVARGDAGGGEEHVVAAYEIVGVQHPAQIVPGGQDLLAFRVVTGPQLRLDRPAHALHGTGGDDAFGRTADAHENVHIGPLAGGADRAGDVAV